MSHAAMKLPVEYAHSQNVYYVKLLTYRPTHAKHRSPPTCVIAMNSAEM